MNLRFYSKDMHKAAFVLPTFVNSALAAVGRHAGNDGSTARDPCTALARCPHARESAPSTTTCRWSALHRLTGGACPLRAALWVGLGALIAVGAMQASRRSY